MSMSNLQPITSLDDLRDHLQLAIGLEWTTIPVYLSALYSIRDGQNTASYQVIQSVVIEEMLHMALAANVLNAIGGTPLPKPVYGISPIPSYPATIPYLPGLGEVGLQRFSPEALKTFMRIEHPDPIGKKQPPGGYNSIGAFYDAIKKGIRKYATRDVFLEGWERRGHCQLSSAEYYGGAGTLDTIRTPKQALQAIDQIVDQGEGVPEAVLKMKVLEHGQPVIRPEHGVSVDDGDVLADGWVMYSHYARFKEILTGRHYLKTQRVNQTPKGAVLPVDWSEVYPMKDNPSARDAKGEQRRAMQKFNATYSALIDEIYAAFNGAKPANPELTELREAVTIMWDLKYQAQALMKTLNADGSGLTLGTPFEYLG